MMLIFFSDCGVHLNVTNGVVTGDTFFEGSTKLSCNRGYLPHGSTTCQDDGQWITDMKCTPIGDCFESKR